MVPEPFYIYYYFIFYILLLSYISNLWNHLFTYIYYLKVIFAATGWDSGRSDGQERITVWMRIRTPNVFNKRLRYLNIFSCHSRLEGVVITAVLISRFCSTNDLGPSLVMSLRKEIHFLGFISSSRPFLESFWTCECPACRNHCSSKVPWRIQIETYELQVSSVECREKETARSLHCFLHLLEQGKWRGSCWPLLVICDKAHRNSTKLHQERFRKDTGISFFIMSVVKHWTNFLGRQ